MVALAQIQMTWMCQRKLLKRVKMLEIKTNIQIKFEIRMGRYSSHLPLAFSPPNPFPKSLVWTNLRRKVVTHYCKKFKIQILGSVSRGIHRVGTWLEGWDGGSTCSRTSPWETSQLNLRRRPTSTLSIVKPPKLIIGIIQETKCLTWKVPKRVNLMLFMKTSLT